LAIIKTKKNPHSFFLDDKETLMNNLFNISTVPANFAVANCPLPFVQDPLAASNSTLNPDYCKFGCCIPCPAQNLVTIEKKKDHDNGLFILKYYSFIKKIGQKMVSWQQTLYASSHLFSHLFF
jgi:hypothetical protein